MKQDEKEGREQGMPKSGTGLIHVKERIIYALRHKRMQQRWNSEVEDTLDIPGNDNPAQQAEERQPAVRLAANNIAGTANENGEMRPRPRRARNMPARYRDYEVSIRRTKGLLQ